VTPFSGRRRACRAAAVWTGDVAADAKLRNLEGGPVEQVTANGSVVTLIHFTHDVDGEYRIACMPGMTEFHETQYHKSYQRANDVRAVTCPACKKTTVFTSAAESLRNMKRAK
jgi:hypothetical protein